MKQFYVTYTGIEQRQFYTDISEFCTNFSGTCVEEQPYNNTNFEKYWTHVSKDKKTDPTFVSGSDRLFKFYLT